MGSVGEKESDIKYVSLSIDLVKYSGSPIFIVKFIDNKNQTGKEC